MRRIIFIFLFPLAAFAQDNRTHLLDLKDQWLVHREGVFSPFRNQSTTAVFFWMDGRKEKRNVLCLEGRHPYSVFINSKLILQAEGNIKLSIDSLADTYSHQLFIELFSSKGVNHLEAKIERAEITANPDFSLREGNFFLDFALLASLVIIIGFISFLRTNPTLTFDYVNFKKLISFQDRDESTLTLRIASSVNLLIYLFCSMFLGLIVLITLHFLSDQVSLARLFPIHSTTQGFEQWLIISIIIFGLLMVKLFWLALVSALFGFRDTVRIQFFNFVRIIFIAMFLLSSICVIFFILKIRTEGYFFNLLLILSIIFTLGTIVTYFKLMSRMRFHFFHLFSYLCASEIIPLMVLIKVLLY